MPRLSLYVAAGLLGVGSLGLTACSDDPPADTPLPKLSDVVKAGLQAQPAAFCDRIDDRILDEVVDGGGGTSHYEPGDQVELAPGLTDVVHEHGCVFSGPDGQVARAWVFVPPVTTKRAKALTTEFLKTEGCQASKVSGYGDPRAVATCTTDGTVTASYRGLMTDTWFACELTDPTITDETELHEQAGRWCAAAINAASAPSN